MKKLLLFLFASPVAALACDDGFEAFKNTVYKQVRRDCTKCHDGTRPNAPAFAVSDVKSSYELLLNYMNFSNPEASHLVERAGNGHCGLISCEEATGKEMAENAVKWWLNGENKCFRNGKYFTEEIPLPLQLPTPAQGFTTLTFNLGETNPDLKDTYFQIDIQDYQAATESTPGAYRVKAPRFVGGQGAIQFRDIKILLNGKHDPIYNAFTIENKIVNFVETGLQEIPSATGVLSGQTMIILKDTLRAPMIRISFVEINSAQNDFCKGSKEFSTTVKPMMEKLNCKSCHNANAPSMPTRVFDLSRSVDQLCLVAKDLTNTHYPSSSALIKYPTSGLFGHPVIAVNQQAEYSRTIKQWIKAIQ